MLKKECFVIQTTWHLRSRPLDIRNILSWANLRAKNAGLTFFKHVLFTVKTLSFSFSSGTFWVVPCCVFNLQILGPLNKPLSFLFKKKKKETHLPTHKIRILPHELRQAQQGYFQLLFPLSFCPIFQLVYNSAEEKGAIYWAILSFPLWRRLQKARFLTARF